ncbi:MAG TPA: hypothetical protein P5307_02515 [Pirellulaceae bacterium]|nr:hypothetical protein [Pirellulaceae bacterium]
MTSQHDKPKRWRFGSRGVIACMTACCVPAILWTWAVQTAESSLVTLAIIASGAAIGSVGGGLFTGTRHGFIVGYAMGALFVLLLPLLLALIPTAT